MQTKYFLAGAAIAGLLLGACEKTEPVDQSGSGTQPQAVGNAAPPPASPVKPQRPVPAPAGQKGLDLLAEAGINLDFPHDVHYDILDTSHAGTRRHRVLLEVRDADFATVIRDFDESLEGLGYTKTTDKDTNGRVEQVYESKGKPAYYLLMQPAGMGPKLNSPDAVGSIHIMWNMS
jgi:hypothetical protein